MRTRLAAGLPLSQRGPRRRPHRFRRNTLFPFCKILVNSGQTSEFPADIRPQRFVNGYLALTLLGGACIALVFGPEAALLLALVALAAMTPGGPVVILPEVKIRV